MVEFVVGLPGSGKTYFCAYHGLKAIREKRPVYSNFPLEGAYILKADDLTTKLFPRGALLCVDEAGLEFNSRNWERFTKDQYMFFCQHRKLGVDLLMAVQHPSRVDVSIREIAHIYWWASNCRLWFKYDGFIMADDRQKRIKPEKEKWLLPWPSVFRKFDTFYMHAGLGARAEAERVPWRLPLV